MPTITRIILEVPGDLLEGRSRDDVCAASIAELTLWAEGPIEVLESFGPAQVFDIHTREVGERWGQKMPVSAPEMPQDRSEGRG
jgi:hypothetical protein